nr:hypothetical protein [Tanacetum cinerariifolium]
ANIYKNSEKRSSGAILSSTIPSHLCKLWFLHCDNLLDPLSILLCTKAEALLIMVA